MTKEEKRAIEDSRCLIYELSNHTDKDFIGRLYYKNKPIEENLEILLNLIEKLQKENEELLEVKVSASAHNRILELEKENEYLKETYKNEKKMKNKYVKLYQGLLLRIKKRIKRYAELQIDYIKKYDEINESLQAMINVLQELLENLESEE